MWQARIADYQASGKSGAQWCREKAVPESSFSTWKKKILESIEEKQTPAARTEWMAVSGESIEVPTAVTIRIGVMEIEGKPGYDATHLQQVLRTVMTIC